MATFRTTRCVVVVFGVAWTAVSAPAQTDCLGFTHTPIGNAQLLCDDNGLTVLGIGDMGEDGVSIDVAGFVPEGYEFVVRSPSLDLDKNPPIGAFQEVRGVGLLDGQPDQVVSVAHYEVATTDVVAAAYDLSPAAPDSVTARVFHDGVFEQEIPDVDPVFSGELQGLKVKVEWSISRNPLDLDIVITLGADDRARFKDSDGPFLVLDGPGNYQVLFIAENPKKVLSDYSDVDVLAGGGLQQFSIVNEEVILTPVPPCYPDFTGDGTLDLFDFLAYVNMFNAADPSADCDGNGALDLFDFLCFVNAFNTGC